MVALLNLIKIIETGTDYSGIKYPTLSNLTNYIDLMIIPCANPDGRSHIPFNSFVGRTLNDLRYYNLMLHLI